MSKTFQVPAFIKGISTMSDRTLKMAVYISKELPGEEKAKIFELENLEGWFCFSENEIQPNDIPKEKAEFEGRKTATERLYNVLYVFWSQQYSGKYGNFSQWREQEMESIISDYKNKLNPY